MKTNYVGDKLRFTYNSAFSSLCVNSESGSPSLAQEGEAHGHEGLPGKTLSCVGFSGFWEEGQVSFSGWSFKPAPAKLRT